jgi:signal transduction histidine kinase
MSRKTTKFLELGPADFPSHRRRGGTLGGARLGAQPRLNRAGGTLAAAEAQATVLIADSAEQPSAALERTLAGEGHRVLLAHTSEAAVDLFVSERPQLILVHERLLAGDGKDLVRRVRALAPLLPLVLMAGNRRRELLREVTPQAVLRDDDEPRRVLEIVDCVLATSRSIERVQAENDVRSLVLAKLCHSLRSPLHVIQGYTDILRDDPEAHAFDDLLERLAGATETALDLVRDYLDLARVEAPGPMIRRDKVDVDTLVMELLNVAGRQIGDRPLRLTTSVPFAGTSIHTDGDKLRVILNQLLANAIKFSSKGDIRLTVRSLGDSTEFIVADRGPGIAQEERHILFSPFRQKLHEELTSTPGQGVGLAIAERMSTLLGASLNVAPRDDGGTIVTLRLPAALVAQSPGHARTLH